MSGLGLRQLVSCQVYFAAIQQFPLYLFARLPVRTLKARYTLSTVKLALSKYRNAIRAVDPDHLVLRPRKMRSGQLSRARTRRNPHAGTPLTTRASTATNPISDRSIRRPSSKPLSNSSPTTATSKKAWAWIALTGRRPAEIFFSASFSLPPKKLPYPALLFDGQLENPTSSRYQLRALPHPRSGRPQETRSGPRHSPVVKELPFPRGR